MHGLVSRTPGATWDLLKKVDQTTQVAFEQSIDDSKRLVNQDEVLKFLKNRFQSLETRGNNQNTVKRTCGSVVNTEGKCSICKKDPHQIYECKAFQNSTPKQKWRYVKDLRLCANCLRTGHQSNACRSQHCTKCTKKHNTLLHPEANKPIKQATSATSAPITAINEQDNGEEHSSAVSLVANDAQDTTKYVLLGTAKIKILAANGNLIECRAILDGGSQVNLITEKLSKKLGFRPNKAQLNLEGVGAKETKLRQHTLVTLKSTINDFTMNLDVHIMPKIVSDQPAYRLNTQNWNIPEGVTLADPEFANPGRIDCLIGAERLFDLLTEGKIKLAENLPTLKNTVFSWIVSGKVGYSNEYSAICGVCTTTELESIITNFWKIEEIPDNNAKITEDDIQCEAHFLQNTTRANDGKFMVKPPLKEHPGLVAGTRELAYHLLRGMP